jgi:ribosome-binding factor A
MKTPIKYKDEKSSSLITRFAAEYFSIESNKDSLITITKTDIFDRGRRALVFFTALPREKEEASLEFAKRRRQDFRRFIMDKKSFGFMPRIDFCIDLGEHNRQRIDELLNESSVENSADKS